MAASNESTEGRRSPYRRPRLAADLLPAALRSLGVPSARLTARIRRAWDAASDDTWTGQTHLRRLEGGVLEVGVTSDALRDELSHFHKERLLVVLRTALPDVALVGVRFVADPADGAGA